MNGKKQRLLGRLLLPTMTVLLLLPPLSCLIFSRAAKQYAYAKAAEDLETLQQTVLPLMRSCFLDQSETADGEGGGLGTDSDQAGQPVASTPASSPAGTVTADRVRNFLSQVGPMVRRMGGDAELMILGGELQIIYPREEADKTAISPLAENVIWYIQTEGLPEAGQAMELSGSDGEVYLVNLYEIPTRSVQLQCLITYCSTSQISAWVREASLLVLAVSSAFVLVIMAVLWMTARSVTRPLHRLCREAERIGGGGFEEIRPDFSLRELEDLRLAMNRMSGQLMRADEIQKTFFQNVSHELRNPLMSISGYAQGIEQGVFHTPQDAAHTILEESARLTELVNSLLTLSRMETGQQDVSLGPVRVADFVEDGLDRLNGLALQKQVSLVLAPFNRGLAAWGEEDLLGKVLDNLLTNAIRYAKTTVTVSAVEESGRVRIAVADDGDGIAEKDLPHLFERCYKGKGGNFGIGLAIARSAAQKMGSELTAANGETGGAIFTLTLQAAT